MKTGKKIRIGILTISDRVSQKQYEDISGKTILKLLKSFLRTPWEPVCKAIPDQQILIERNLRYLCDKKKCAIVITTGGTGPAKKDVTPEALENVCGKLLPGFGELMRSVSLKEVPTAILSRQTAGIRKRSLIISLPGNPSAIKTCLTSVFPVIPHCLDIIEGPHLACHANRIKIYQPLKKK